jgi:hypothetical protein
MPETLKADFAIEVKFAPNTPDPSRVFRSMTALIDSFQRFDKELVQAIDLKIEPILFLEDIETSSLRTWLRSVITSVDDSALRDGDWKKIVGSYLLKSKYILINKLDGKTQITSRNEIKEIEGELLAAAEATDIKRIPSYQPMPESRIIEAIDDIGNALAHLSLGDSAKLMTPDGEAKFNLTLKVSPDSLRDLIVKESLTHESVMILKVKRPDYLGEAMWDFKFGEHPLQAKILDLNWLAAFQSRKVDVRPGDAIRAKVHHTTHYGFDAEVVFERAEIIQVLEVIALVPENQPPLLEG